MFPDSTKMKFNYQFSNLLGTVYRSGNLLFTPDGNSVISPVGNKISGNQKSTILMFSLWVTKDSYILPQI